jgi:hypothetical protein
MSSDKYLLQIGLAFCLGVTIERLLRFFSEDGIDRYCRETRKFWKKRGIKWY